MKNFDQLLMHFSLIALANIRVSCSSTFRQTQSRRLNAAPPPVVESGWVTGRATYTGTPGNFIEQFGQTGQQVFGNPQTAWAGSCGYYNGNSGNNLYSAVTTPTAMRAGAGDSNIDFPGSCGRCYEVQCVTGIVTGNYTDDGAPIPMPLAIASPPYTWNISPATALPTDDSNRTFPGNAASTQHVLHVQCWNRSDAAPVIVQITDNNACTYTDQNNVLKTNAIFCTNVDNLQLDYHAFQELAHPDYGLMNLKFRPVSCYTQQSLPTIVPGFVNTTIISDRVETGWTVSSYGDVNQQLQQAGIGVSSGNVTCFTIPSTSAGLQFKCRECTSPGYQPFLFNKTVGIELSIVSTTVRYTIDTAAALQVPDLQLSLGDASQSGPCSGSSVSLQNLVSNMTKAGRTPAFSNGLTQLQILFPNPGLQECVPHLKAVTTISFMLRGANPPAASFCLANMRLLNQTTLPDEANLSEVPSVGNCFMPEPEPTNQGGAYVDLLATNASIPEAANISEAKPDEGYTVFPHQDLQNYIDLTVSIGQNCTSDPNWSIQTTSCALQYNHQCCLVLSDANDTDPNLAKSLASICTGMRPNITGITVCQAFIWDATKSLVFFKGQPVNAGIPRSWLCNQPKVTACVLNAALSESTDPGHHNDTRWQKLWQNSKHRHSLSWNKAWSIGGSVIGVMTATAGALFWILLLNSYRLEKKMLVKQVVRHVTAHDLCNMPASASSFTPNPLLLTSTRSSCSIDAPMITAPISNIVNSQYLDDDQEDIPEAAEDIRKAAKQIVLRCLQRWDGFLGLRAATDSQGMKTGIWRARYESVRYASLLLAFRKYNNKLENAEAGSPGSLFKAWTQSNWKHQGLHVAQLAKVLLSISTEEAQSLPNKDPETVGIHDRLCSGLNACKQCVRRRN